MIENARQRNSCLLVGAVSLTGLILFVVAKSASANEDSPQNNPKSPFTAEEASYWAFQRVVTPEIPTISDSTQVHNPIDNFTLKRLQDKGLRLSSPAEKHDLIRRVTFDLWGLPPTVAQVAAFIDDESPDAYQKLVDRLLASPRYGERWGRYWLDVVRFSETAGFNADPLRPLAYKYRDYVIRAFNNDTPYDRFVQEQLAGDELFPEDQEALIATGFNRLWPDESNASNVELARQSMLNDMTGTVGAVFLGMSLGCAQCHDHKFDPILQKDFYRLQAFFAPMIPMERAAVGNAESLSDYEKQLEQWQAETESLRQELWDLELAARKKVTHIKRLKFPAVVLEAIDTPPWQRTALQHQLSFWSERQIAFKEKQILDKLEQFQKTRRELLKTKLREFKKQKPTPPVELTAMVSLDGSETPQTALLAGGSYNKPLEEVLPGFPTILQSDKTSKPAVVTALHASTTGRRSTLARWITEPDNPLTARVMVNRIWQGHFGRGIVANANDFGTQTELPSHPQLLDWLAVEFQERGWSVKAMHRLIMTSATYRQSSRDFSAEAKQHDPGNRWYSRYPRRRLDAEAIRDALLAVSGELNLKMYGPGVKPTLPPNFSVREGWEPTKDVAERNRRSIYILAKRNLPYPLLQVFDFPDTHESCARRQETTIAPQALTLLNSELVLELAEKFTARLFNAQQKFDVQELIQQAYREALGREADEAEISAATQFINAQHALISQRRAAGKPSRYPADFPRVIDPAWAAAMVDFCHALLNSNEFMYVD